METLALGIDGMHCGTCAGNIEKRLYGVDGVQSAVVSFAEEAAEIIYDPSRTGVTQLANTISEAGYAARLSEATLAAAAVGQSAPVQRGHTNSGCG